MSRRLVGGLACGIALAFTASCTSRPAAIVQPAPHHAPAPVVVALVVDQLASWVFEMHRPHLAAEGGFARLLREGSLDVRMEYAYAATDTALGHATLFTGRWPREHGITSNEVLVPGARQSILGDPSSHLIDGSGVRNDFVGSSLSALRGDTVADELRRARPGACIVALSLKDRATLPGAGRKPSLALFFDPRLQSFVGSTAFATELPPSVRDHLSVESLAGRVWQPLDADSLARRAPTADDAPGEGGFYGLGAVFPHTLPADQTGRAFRATPFADEALFGLAVRALDDCEPGQPVLLTISLSAHDYVLHTYGPHSWEAFDHFARLDRSLGAFLSTLDQRFGPGGYAVQLAADHGSAPLPELVTAARPWCAPGAANPWQLPCRSEPGSTAGNQRLAVYPLQLRLEARAATVLGEGPWILGISDPRVVFTEKAQRLPTAQRQRLIAALESELLDTGGVERVYDLAHDSWPQGCGADDDVSLDALVCRATAPRTQGDLYVVVSEGSFFDPGFSPGYGESHGSPKLHDRAVPRITRHPDEPGGQVHERPIPSTAYAATLRRWLGLAPR